MSALVQASVSLKYPTNQTFNVNLNIEKKKFNYIFKKCSLQTRMFGEKVANKAEEMI